MGLYDNIKFKNPEDKDIILQTKVLDRSLQTYKIGDIINSTDGIFFCHEGAYVVFNSVIVAAFDSNLQYLYDKWGNDLKHPNLIKNPLKYD